MNMALICMGRLKEKYWRDAANEYEKRLSRFGKFEEIELPDLPEPANSSPAVEARICEKEGRAILQKVREDDIVIALCIGGKQLDSVQLSEKLTQFSDTGRRVVFIIGGSLGLSPQVVARDAAGADLPRDEDRGGGTVSQINFGCVNRFRIDKRIDKRTGGTRETRARPKRRQEHAV